MKFGGTSVADPDAINRLIGIVRDDRSRDASAPPIVVVSALSGVTDKLVAVTRLAEEGDSVRAAAMVDALLERHITVAAAVTAATQTAVVAELRREFGELNGLIHALAV